MAPGGTEIDDEEEWEMLVDNGYQGITDYIRAVHLKKAPTGVLSPTDKRRNDKISKDQIIMENGFGRKSKH